MIKRRLLSYDIPQLTKVFKKDFPQLVTMAEESESAALFKEALRSFVFSRIDKTVGGSNMGNAVAKRILLLIEHDGMMVFELSTGEEMPVRTITCLWQFLAGKLEEDVSPDFFIDLYWQFELLEKPEEIVPDRSLVKRQMNRWPTGLDEEVMAIRYSNKERIIAGLIRKIERRHAPTSRFQFTEGMSYAEKYVKVQEWWNIGRFHLAMAFKSPTELNYFLGGSLSAGTMDLLARARKKGMPFFVTPYYLSLLNTNTSGYDDAAIRSYILYSEELVDTYGRIKAWEKEDIVVAGQPNAAGWLLPEGHNILDAVYKMAVRKRKANESRPEGEKYAELQRVRLGSRLLAYLPLRITDELVGILRSFKDKASRVGVTQFIIQTHFQSPLEVTPEAKKAIEAILSAGWIITNQLVYTVAASRRGHTAKLRQTLNAMGVVCYYTFSVKGFHENYAVFAPNSRSLQEQQEEKVFGLIPKEKQKELYRLIRYERPLGKKLSGFLKENRLLFAATDRSVLNLPAIGKSMTFQMVGLTTEGKRILKFDHDTGRRHSPIIDRMGEVYIVENKSVAAYLRQLQDMGEDVREYISIWNYSEGRTEPRFSIYEYPDYPFDVTEKMTNLEL